MFEDAIRIVRIRGFDVRVTRSWVVVALLVAALLFAQFASSPRGAPLAGAMAVSGTAAFFLSILGHEIAHALTAQRRGVEVHGITLFLFGGVTEMHMDVRRPRDEFAVAAVGPYVSLVIAAAMGLLVVAVEGSSVAGLQPVAEVAGLVGWLNVLVAGFNLLPGAPLDGGRVLRSLLWAVTGDHPRAMRWASRAGQAVGLLLVPAHWAVVRWVTGASPRLVDLAVTALIGWFMLVAATRELDQARFQAVVSDRSVGDLRPAEPPSLPADDPAGSLGALLRADGSGDGQVIVVVDAHGHTTGVVTATELAGRHDDDPADRTVGDVARPLEGLPTITSTEPLLTLLRILDSDGEVVVEEHDGVPRRVLTRAAVGAALRDLQDGAPRLLQRIVGADPDGEG